MNPRWRLYIWRPQAPQDNWYHGAWSYRYATLETACRHAAELQAETPELVYTVVEQSK